jgi:competence protein ComEA
MSLTSGERRALTWLLAIAAAGGGVRLVARLGDAGAATPESGEALRRQLIAVDSAQRADRQRERFGRPPRARRSRAPAIRAAPEAPSGRPDTLARHLPTLPPVDVDVADSAALERLPRIGPALAARIVADRQRHGPFGSLAALQRVRGIGPKLSAGLAAFVTFTGNPRPSAVQR